MFAVRKAWVALGFGIVGCAGSSTPDVPSSTDDDNSVKVPAFGGSNPSPPPQPSASTEPVDKTPGPDETPQSAGKPPECPTEIEPNNEAGQASEFTSCITGELTSWTDTDNLQIEVPEGAAEMVIDHIEPKGAIQYAVTSGGVGGTGSSNMSFTDQAPKTKVKPGTKYVFALKWNNDGSGQVDDKRTYAIRVAFLH